MSLRCQIIVQVTALGYNERVKIRVSDKRRMAWLLTSCSYNAIEYTFVYGAVLRGGCVLHLI